MNKIVEFLKDNKKELYFVIPIYLCGALLIGARQKAFGEPYYFLWLGLTIPLILMIGFMFSLFIGGGK